MKKVKISELPLFSSLKGLYTIGTNDQNQSVKVSLEFVEEETQKAVQNANTATSNANAATDKAKQATTNADTATANANAATEAAKTATTNADTATDKANAATEKANTAADNADTATANAKEATTKAIDAKEKTVEAITKADTATENANNAATEALTAKADITAMLQRLVPTGLSVSCIKRITVSNTQPVYIKAVLTPSDTMQNVIFISDNRACFVTVDGRIKVLSEGTSTIQVIPTCNVALAKTISVEVGKPFARLNTTTSLRFTSAKTFRLT